MKYAPHIYARAFLEVKPDPEKFLSVVLKNGDYERLDKIVEAIEMREVQAHGGRIVELEFARISELAKKFKFSSHDRVHTKINPSLVAGVRVTVDGEQELDVSLQRKLNKLFQ